MDVDYSLYYREFHDESEAHATRMAEWICTLIGQDLPVDRATPVLDIGCGFGFALRALSMLGFNNVRGIDTSYGQVKVAERANLPASLVSDSIAYLNEHEADFGVILLLDVLEHVPVSLQIEFVRSIEKSLVADGRLILTVPNANSPLAARWRYGDFTHCCSFTEHSLAFVLRNGGFWDIKIDNSKGIGRLPPRWWRREQRGALRKWIVRFIWAQVFAAELPSDQSIESICFELNLKAVGYKQKQRAAGQSVG